MIKTHEFYIVIVSRKTTLNMLALAVGLKVYSYKVPRYRNPFTYPKKIRKLDLGFL